jgi:hypothetical protein
MVRCRSGTSGLTGTAVAVSLSQDTLWSHRGERRRTLIFAQQGSIPAGFAAPAGNMPRERLIPFACVTAALGNPGRLCVYGPSAEWSRLRSLDQPAG